MPPAYRECALRQNPPFGTIGSLRTEPRTPKPRLTSVSAQLRQQPYPLQGLSQVVVYAVDKASSIKEQGGFTINEDKLQEIFYHDCFEADVEWAKRQFQVQPAAPGGTPVDVTGDKFGSVKRTYIECQQDRVISPSAQKKMYTDLPCSTVVAMNTGHFPLLSAPEELAGHIDSLATLN